MFCMKIKLQAKWKSFGEQTRFCQINRPQQYNQWRTETKKVRGQETKKGAH